MPDFDNTTLWISFSLTLIAFTLLWGISLKLEDVGIVDYYWGPGFALIGWIGFARLDTRSYPVLLLLVLITLWMLRLSAHLIWRHRRSMGEDARYARMRLAGGPNFKRNSLIYIFWLQAIIQFAIALPVHAISARATIGEANTLYWFGIALFGIGFYFEASADFALARFKASNQGQLLTSGLFAWSRHPNYFGEAMLWWGLAIAAYAISLWPYLFLGPAILTFLLLKVSGVTLLEQHLRSRPGFEAWARATSAFLPLPPQRKADAKSGRATRAP